MRLKYFSTFTGIGGLDYGLELLGAECVGFSEIKESSMKVYNSHYPTHKCVGDITKIDPKNLPDFDVFTGGFPCQTFSIAGMRKGFSERKGQMIFYIYDILKEKKPKYVVLENVKGILNHDNGNTVRNVFGLLKAAGYYTRILLLNSVSYGSAQARERVVFLSSLEDFEKVLPESIDNTKRFRDIRDSDKSHYKYLSDIAMTRMLKMEGGFSMIGGYDKVNTLTTGMSSSGRVNIIVQEDDGIFRYLTENEGERLQGFPDDWTKGISQTDRWFAIGNAVNCKMSEYIFTNYLAKVWGLEKAQTDA